MRHKELKKFTFNHPPTGVDIVELIKDNELHGWRMDITQRTAPYNPHVLTMGSGYLYDVVFEKDVE